MAQSKPPGACAICGAPIAPRYKPFCSKRCADIDLNRWFSGVYAAPAAEEDDPEFAEPDITRNRDDL